MLSCNVAVFDLVHGGIGARPYAMLLYKTDFFKL